MFSERELRAARRNTLPVVRRHERPFDLEHALEVYASGLPRAETRTTQAWRTGRWLDDWGCDPTGRRFEGLLDQTEAAFWWLAWTHVDRLGDSADSADSVVSLKASWEALEPPFDAAWCLDRLERFQRAASDYYDVWALTSMAPAATHLRVLLGRPEAFAFVLQTIPPRRLAGWVEWIGAPEPGESTEEERMRAMADAWAERFEPTEESLTSWTAIAKQTRAPKVITAAQNLAETLVASRPRFASTLADLARFDTTPGAFSTWALDHHVVPPPAVAQEMVARDGTAGTQAIAEALSRAARKASARRVSNGAELLAALEELPLPVFVEPVLALLDRPDCGVAARSWLRTNGGDVAPRLVELALGRSDVRCAALQQLDELRILHPAAWDTVRHDLRSEDVERLESAMSGQPAGVWALDDLPEWAAELATADPWGRPLPEPERELLPALTSGGLALPDEVVDGLLARLSAVRLELDMRTAASRDEVPTGVATLREHLDPASADRFARSLFDIWLRAESRDELRWAMRSVAFLAGNDTLDHVTEIVRHHRQWGSPEDALSCLDALRRHGSPYARTLLGWLWLRHPAPRIRRHARLELEAAANGLNTNVETLLDRNVPTLGFDDDGLCSIPRSPSAADGPAFVLQITTDGDVEWKEGPGKRSADEEPDANVSRELLEGARRRVSIVSDLHAQRWERTMVDQRTFSQDSWRQNILSHPILRHLARAVVWKVCDDDGELLYAVRLDPERELSNIHDAPEQLGPWDQIGVAHPADFTPEQLERWSAIFAEYELIQPFAQLDRPVFRPEAVDLAGRVIETQELRARMARHGWEPLRGANQMIVAFQRRFSHTGITARIDFAEGFAIRPISAGGLVPEDAELAALTFHDAHGDVPIDAVPPGVFSEAATPFQAPLT